MSRVADSTIKGFLYQFNLTLKKILEAKVDTEITVEGVIEDIDVSVDSNIEAIQCKYHEEQAKFELSKIYKPILQMLKTYLDDKDRNIKYTLYMYFPNESEREDKLTFEEIEKILKTQDIELISYIANIFPPADPDLELILKKSKKKKEEKEKLLKYYKLNIDTEISKNEKQIKTFIENRLTLIFGVSFEKLELTNKSILEALQFTGTDLDEIFYPNAIQTIANLSTKKNSTERVVTNQKFLSDLRNIKTTAISRWTKELYDYKKLLTRRRKQLHSNLNINNRKRYFIIDVNQIKDFNDDIVLFICDYISKYTHKPNLHKTLSLFCLVNGDKALVDELENRLYSKDVRVETGYTGEKFNTSKFIREPKIISNDKWFQFQTRICYENEQIIEIINSNKPDDLFVISNKLNDKYVTSDLNIEYLDITSFKELKYLLAISQEV